MRHQPPNFRPPKKHTTQNGGEEEKSGEGPHRKVRGKSKIKKENERLVGCERLASLFFRPKIDPAISSFSAPRSQPSA